MNEKSLKASYLVSLQIAKTLQPHTIAEKLSLPMAKDLVVENLIGEVQAQKLEEVPVFNNKICRCIQGIADYLKSQLVRRVQKVRFLQFSLMKA